MSFSNQTLPCAGDKERTDGRRWRQRRQQLERGRKAAQERPEAAVVADQPLIQRQRP